ncbi:MAG: PAS domain S-box protein [Candidatus Hodarchaeota archaeon]
MPNTIVKENPSLLSALTSSTTDLLAFYEAPSMEITWANKAHVDALGMPLEEILGKRCYAIWHQRSAPCDDCPVVKAFSSGKEEESETTGADGRNWWIKGQPVKDNEGNVIGVLEVTRNITDRKKMEEELRESKELYESLLKTIPDPVVVLQDGIYKYTNTTFTDVFGYTQDDVKKGLSFYKLVKEKDRGIVKQRYEDRLAGKEMSKIFTINLISKDGREIMCETSATKIEFEGRPADLVVMRDISERVRAKETAIETEMLLKKSQKAARLGYYEMDLNNNTVKASDELKEIMGLDLLKIKDNEYLDYLVNKLVHPEDKKTVKRAIEGILLGERSDLYEFRIVRPDGSIRTLWGDGELIKDDNGNPVKLVGTAQDVTDRIIAEEKLKESEQRYRRIIESIPIGMLIYNLHYDNNLVFKGANPAADKILGVDCTQFIGKTIEEAFPPLKETEVPQKYKLAAREGIAWETRQIDYEDEQIQGAYEVWAFQTSPGEMVASFFDITERIRAEENLKKSEERYRLITENSNDMISIVNETKRYEYVNEASHLKYLGCTGEEMLKIGPIDLVPPDQLNKIILQFKDIWKTKKGIMEIQLKNKKTGKYNWFETAVTVFEDKSGKSKLLSVTRDISERKKVKELLERENTRLKEMDRIRKEFVSNAAHELKTPLIPIYSATEFLLMKYKDQMVPDVRELIETTFRGAKKLRQLLGELLDVSRLDMRKIELKIEKVNVVDVINGVITSVEEELLNHGHKVNVNVPDLVEIEVDKVRIEQVITNLFTNAIKNTPKNGEIAVNVKKNENQVEISVSDNGVGITTEEFKNLFTQFGTFNRRASELGIDGGGTGLGLYISKEIMELHGGMIEAKSEGRNKGATFTIYLPIVE